MHTLTAKARMGLVMVEGQAYQITDIGMRMLLPRELFRAQGFPEGYIIDRGADGQALTKTAQIRMCGNSVCPPIAAALVAANGGTGKAQEVA
jgi:DNA (cytosine-5)-methyltransferase 1